MLPLLASLASLLFGTAVLIAGHGLLISLVPIRIGAAGFSSQIVGFVATGYYVGLLAGRACPSSTTRCHGWRSGPFPAPAPRGCS